MPLVKYEPQNLLYRMPDTADSNKISAKGKNGVLTIQIGKKEVAKPQSIKIVYE